MAHVWTQAWEAAMQLDVGQSALDEKGLTEGERALLMLQAHGMTDEAAAKVTPRSSSMTWA